MKVNGIDDLVPVQRRNSADELNEEAKIPEQAALLPQDILYVNTAVSPVSKRNLVWPGEKEGLLYNASHLLILSNSEEQSQSLEHSELYNSSEIEKAGPITVQISNLELPDLVSPEFILDPVLALPNSKETDISSAIVLELPELPQEEALDESNPANTIMGWFDGNYDLAMGELSEEQVGFLKQILTSSEGDSSDPISTDDRSQAKAAAGVAVFKAVEGFLKKEAAAAREVRPEGVGPIELSNIHDIPVANIPPYLRDLMRLTDLLG